MEKAAYQPLLDTLVELVRPGGLLVFDNTAFASAGGFVFTQVHNIQPGVPPENIVAMFEAVAEFDGA